MPSETLPPLDRLSALFERFRVRAHLFFSGSLCGVTHFEHRPGRAFLHVLRRGELEVRHRPRSGAPRRLVVREPTLLLYPRPLVHDFHHAPQDGSDFVCATIDFEGGERHPIVQALPPFVAVAIADLPELEPTLNLLFAEAQRVRCGQRLLADRLFEVLLLQVLRWMLDHPHEWGRPAGLMSGLAHPNLARALTALHEDPARAWPLEDLARQAHMSRSAFAAAFKAHVGLTPAAYRLQWRVALAQARLRDGAAVKRVCDELGYESPAAFSRAFRQATGQAPRTWLKAQAAPGRAAGTRAPARNGDQSA